MNHKGTVTLETNRLILRRFRLDDAQAMYDNWASDPEVTKFLTWPVHGSVEISRFILQSWVDAYSEKDAYPVSYTHLSSLPALKAGHLDCRG